MAARKRTTPPKGQADDATPLLSIKLSADVVKSARIVASLYDQSMSDLLSGILRPILKDMEDKGFTKRRKDREAGE